MSEAQAKPQRRVSPLSIAFGILAVIVFALVSAAGIYTDWLWFRQLDFEVVFFTQIVGQIVAFLIGFVIMTLLVAIGLMTAWRSRPVYLKMPDESPFQAYQQLLDGLRRVIMLGLPALLGVFGGLIAAREWQTAALWLNGGLFGVTDPQFGLDVGFFVFDLPFYGFAVSYVSGGIFLAALINAGVHLIYGGIRFSGREVTVSKPARIQLSILIATYFILQGLSLWLDQYGTATSAGELFTGVTYTDDNAVIPGLQILALISLAVAVAFIVTAVLGQWRVSIIATALMVASSLVLGGLYPWIVQTFQVVPNERTLEGPYLQKNIDATRVAYGLDKVEVVDYAANVIPEPGALRNDARTTSSIRIMDPALVGDAFRQLEQYRQYYSFPNRLHVDRYAVDGETRDTIIAVRELNQAGLGESQSWYNSSVVYTHGFGLVAAYGNKVDSDGKPLFFQSGIPTVGDLGDFEPRIYFGANSPTYSIVGADDGAEPLEFDFPAGEGESNETYTTFSGNGGPLVGNIFTKIAYSLKFQSEQILLSDAINAESQILYNRSPAERIAEVAPYLTVDTEIYPAIVDGRIKWIVDGYTTTTQYPYSNLESFNLSILDSSSETFNRDTSTVNYIRNSVKATVDAYDGSVDLYQWDEDDPLLEAWMKLYPDTVQPKSAMSGDLMAHVRYPSDLFKTQRSVLGNYHVKEAGAFYSQQDAWMTPNDPVEGTGLGSLQPPYYLTMQTPGETDSAFSLYSTFIPQSTGESTRNVLTGYLIANADAGSEAGQVSDNYGKLTLLSLPRETVVPGPGQVQNNFNADSEVSSLLNILRQGSTNVISGNLLTLPVAGGLLYVQPVYIESTGETSYPLLEKVLVAFGDQIAFEDSLDQALDALFGGDSGFDPNDTDAPVADDAGEEPVTEPAPTESGNTALDEALTAANSALADKQAALMAGDLAAFAKADDRLTRAIEDALAALD
ncbi:hypothetical protein IMCC13023_06400 [Candidatus Aquiluna sp. IMCC13023]|uniref:UPF0182 family membrane protein n=1 Tax=Candidatus Aquiluna sp. IMCC13023 TaxID=1081644 RepID=UPI00025B320F|nr:UPF0182 family protein [Candidatus Aquiluna sp. IMCC13023]EIC92161.1 hypothetical protein IMCC13023_06400 [Candidatus Aquiluna sp. IMCC13023]